MLGDSVMLLVLSMWVKTLTDSNAMAGLTFFFMVLPALGAPLLGVWVDRLPRKPILVWGNLASAAAVLPLVLVRDEGDVWLIWAVAFLYGVSFVVLPAAVNGAAQGPAARGPPGRRELQPGDIKEGFRLVRAAGRRRDVRDGGRLAGRRRRRRDASRSAAAFIATIRVTETAPPPRTGFRDEVVAGLRFIVGDRVLRNVLIGMAASILVIGFFESSIYALLDAFDKAPTFAGILVTVQGVGAIAGGLTSRLVVRRLGEVAATVAGLATMACSTAVVALAPNMAVVFAGVGHPRGRDPVDLRRVHHADAAPLPAATSSAGCPRPSTCCSPPRRRSRSPSGRCW